MWRFWRARQSQVFWGVGESYWKDAKTIGRKPVGDCDGGQVFQLVLLLKEQRNRSGAEGEW